MSEITTLQPELLWKWFDQICAIPHPSHHEDTLANFIVNWAKEKHFFAERDEAGNVLIRKPATIGMENRTPVVLQAHLDMVPQANEGNPHDFTKDPIRPYIDGDWVKAKGTTLGSDNGIGLASTLAVLESDNIAHPPLEVLLTMTEETGMDGALHLRRNWLQSDILINTDTEEVEPNCKLVDLPGYGYAAVPEQMKIQWQKSLGEYLQKRECLAGLVVLMDIRHPLKDLDQQMIEWAVSADLPVLLLLTKADKLSQSARSKQVKMVREAILPFQGDIQVEAFSAQNKIGIDKLAAKLDFWFSPFFAE